MFYVVLHILLSLRCSAREHVTNTEKTVCARAAVTFFQASPSKVQMVPCLCEREGLERPEELDDRSLKSNFRQYRQMERQRWEESERRKGQKRKSQQKEVQSARKGSKSQNTVFFQCVGGPEARKVGSLKRRVRSHLVR